VALVTIKSAVVEKLGPFNAILTAQGLFFAFAEKLLRSG
jgi:hypothetical protein